MKFLYLIFALISFAAAHKSSGSKERFGSCACVRAAVFGLDKQLLKVNDHLCDKITGFAHGVCRDNYSSLNKRISQVEKKLESFVGQNEEGFKVNAETHDAIILDVGSITKKLCELEKKILKKLYWIDHNCRRRRGSSGSHGH